MRLDPPRFWGASGKDALLTKVLSPIGAAYHAVVQRRLESPGYKASVPVICIGNATVGGVGKTPFVRMLAENLADRGHAPHILTRGYGGSEVGPHRVAPGDSAERVGDEPLMLAQSLPVWVSRDRAAGAQAIEAASAGLIVMDDGFQNPSLRKTLSLMLVDGVNLFGNGAVFPAGPLRENAASAAARADALVAIVTDENAGVPDELERLAAGKPVFRAWFAIDQASVPKGPLVAFCGIGRPKRFCESLVRAGADVLSFRSFPDHHRFTAKELAGIAEEAARLDARLVTTEKDYARLAQAERGGITPIMGSMQVADADAWIAWVEDRI